MNKRLSVGGARHAEIAGAGFSGLVAAVALAQRGWSVRMHERTPFVRAAGFGIATHQNTTRVLDALGVFEAVRIGSMPMVRMEIYNAKNEMTASTARNRSFRISRQHMITVLADKARSLGVEILTESPVAAATAEGELVLESGKRLKADLVIGADGCNSRVRDSLDLLAERIWLNDGALRFMIPRGAGEPACDPAVGGPLREYWSGTRRFHYSACSPDDIHIAMSCLYSDERGKTVPLDAAAWKQSFPHLEGVIDRIAAHAPWERVIWERFQQIRLKRWSCGRVAIIGDAANAMPPNLGQGGGCAMMNALALAVALDERSEVPQALDHWETRERPLTEHTQRWSRLYSHTTTMPEALRSLVFAATGRIGWLRGQLQRTANHTPTGCA